jgi:hypothetical protein
MRIFARGHPARFPPKENLTMLRTTSLLLAPAVLLASVASALAQGAPKAKARTPRTPQTVATDQAAAGPDFATQGEYVGEFQEGGNTVKLGVQIIAQGNGKFHAVGYPGGLPGDGWDGIVRIEADSKTKDGAAVFTHEDGTTGTVKNGALVIKDPNGGTIATLKKVFRKSPTLGAKPPAGAVVLFDGKSAEAFVDGRVKDGLLLEGSTSKQKFQSYKIHLEFMIPFMPNDRGQGRGNSGYYSQGRYETQILDSFGLVPQKDDCAAIYGIQAPKLNMCYPPLSWQTYDIDYTAAVYEGNKKVKQARLTVLHNGVEVQKDVEATHATTAAPVREGPEPGPVYLQNHGNPVRFRNIWLVEKK